MSKPVTIEDIANRVDSAMGNKPVDLVIRNVRLLNLFTGNVVPTDIAIVGQRIVAIGSGYKAKKEIDGKGRFAVPGFINAHVHVESSLLVPSEFQKIVLPRGTTTIVCDPHEMANVVGTDALKYFFEAARESKLDMFVQLPSCVPATAFETSGAVLNVEDLEPFFKEPLSFGLAEMMNVPGVLFKDPGVLAKIAATHNAGKGIDGHAPDVRGRALQALIACGVQNDHESFTAEEAAEKMANGMRVFIREGSVCKNLAAMVPLINARTASRFAFCTDDRKPHDIQTKGDVDNIVREAIALGVDVTDAYRIATLSGAEAYGFTDRGEIKPGALADIVLVNDLRACDVQMVVKRGQVVNDDMFPKVAPQTAIGLNSVHVKEVTAADFAVEGDGMDTPVIGLIKDQIVTDALYEDLPSDGRFVYADPTQDVLKLAVVERHKKTGNIAISFAKGFGIDDCAIASTHGHDSHNITVVGSSDEQMALAVNRIREIQGGFVVVHKGKVAASVSLPVAGLMTNDAEKLMPELHAFHRAIDLLKPAVHDPLLHLAFLPLCVIPKWKLTDKGLVELDIEGGKGLFFVEQKRPTFKPDAGLGRRVVDCAR